MNQELETQRAGSDMDVAVPPFDYNPSSWRQRVPICLLAAVAAVIAVHLAMFQWRLIDYVWDPIFGKQSERVLTSNVAQWMDRLIGIPDAALGALAYLGDAIFGLAGSTRRWQYRPWMVIIFGIDVIPLGLVSAILVFAQAFIVGQYCFLCIATAVISLILVYMAYDEVYVSCLYLWKVWRRGGSFRVFWRTLWGRPTPEADRIAEAMIWSK